MKNDKKRENKTMINRLIRERQIRQIIKDKIEINKMGNECLKQKMLNWVKGLILMISIGIFVGWVF